jgi:hypothetical protein
MSYVTQTGWRSPRRARFIAINVLVVLAAFALVWMGRASAQSVWIGGSGADEGGPSAAATRSISTTISKADAVDTTDQACTSSTQFIDLPEMLVSFKAGGKASQPVIVLFQGEWQSDDELIAEIRLTIDGVIQPGPGNVRVDHLPGGERPRVETHGFNFLSDRLAPGLHVARIQWRADGGGLFRAFCVNNRSLIVMHK